jgi:hypothetical protein
MGRREELEAGVQPVPTPREINEAIDALGEDRAWEVGGIDPSMGLSAAEPDQLRAIVKESKIGFDYGKTPQIEGGWGRSQVRTPAANIDKHLERTRGYD